jgi:hypothetical protein
MCAVRDRSQFKARFRGVDCHGVVSHASGESALGHRKSNQKLHRNYEWQRYTQMFGCRALVPIDCPKDSYWTIMRGQ